MGCTIAVSSSSAPHRARKSAWWLGVIIFVHNLNSLAIQHSARQGAGFAPSHNFKTAIVASCGWAASVRICPKDRPTLFYPVFCLESGLDSIGPRRPESDLLFSHLLRYFVFRSSGAIVVGAGVAAELWPIFCSSRFFLLLLHHVPFGLLLCLSVQCSMHVELFCADQ